MNVREELNRRLGDTKPIPGFRVMEWLRGVRDAEYELSIKDPKAYQRKVEAARRKVDIMIKEQEQRVKKLQPA